MELKEMVVVVYIVIDSDRASSVVSPRPHYEEKNGLLSASLYSGDTDLRPPRGRQYTKVDHEWGNALRIWNDISGAIYFLSRR